MPFTRGLEPRYTGAVARIRIIDEWLRSPVSAPSRVRSIMVVSSSWSEQRVLMRAYSGSIDQTRPTIVLHGVEFAIGPAGVNPHNEWGIHVEPPIDGRAQELREQLELASRRLAGSKGNPPRLLDEVPQFEEKHTNIWAPGTPRATPAAEQMRAAAYEPGSRVAAPSAKTMMVPAEPQASVPTPRANAHDAFANPSSQESQEPRAIPFSAPAAAHQGNKGGGFRSTSALATHRAPSSPQGPRPRTWSESNRARTRPGQLRLGRKTQLGFDSAATEQAPNNRQASEPRPATQQPQQPQQPQQSARSRRPSLAHLVGHTMPLGFHLTTEEREVLNALGQADALTASDIARIAGVGNGIDWMEGLMSKLAEHGLDLVEPGDARGGEPTYLLRR